MRLLVDTANLDTVKRSLELGIVSGVTMNPGLVAREGKIDFVANLRAICALPLETVLVQVVSTDMGGMVAEGERLAEIGGPKIYVKIPPTVEGIKAIKALAAKGVGTAATGTNTLANGLVAAIAGAAFVIPYLGFTVSYEESSLDLPRQMRQMFRNYGFPTRVMLAVRTPGQALQGALAGVEACTMSYEALRELYVDLTTEKRTEDFLLQWRAVFGQADWVTGLENP